MIEWQQQQHQQHQGDEGGKRMKSMIFQMDFSAIQIQFRMVHQIVVHCDWILVITLALDRAYFIPKNICTMKGFYTPWIDHSIFEYNVTIKTKAKSKSIELLTKRKHKATLNGKGIRFYSFSLLAWQLLSFYRFHVCCAKIFKNPFGFVNCIRLAKGFWIFASFCFENSILIFDFSWHAVQSIIIVTDRRHCHARFKCLDKAKTKIEKSVRLFPRTCGSINMIVDSNFLGRSNMIYF